MTPTKSSPDAPPGLLGELLSPDSYRHLAYHLVSLPLGLLYFVTLVAGLSLGLGTLVIVLGAVVLLGTLWLIGVFADVERALGRTLLGLPLARRRRGRHAPGVWNWARAQLTDAGTYKAALYLLLKMPFGLLSFILTAVLLATSAALTFGPFVYAALPPAARPPVVVGNEAFTVTPLALVALAVAGLALLVLSVSLLNLLARGWALVSVALLTEYGESASAQREVQALRRGARSVAYSGDLPETLRELLSQGVRATAARAALVTRGGAVLAASGLPETSDVRALYDLIGPVPPGGRAELVRGGAAPLGPGLGTLASFTLYTRPLPAGESASDEIAESVTPAELHVAYAAHAEPPVRELEFWAAVADQAAVAVETERLLRVTRREASEQERARVARELHDSVAQALYGIALGARTARASLAQDTDAGRVRAAESLEYTVQLADGATAEMKALLFALRPDALEEGGLTPALARLAEVMRLRYRLDATFDAPEEPDVGGDVKGALYRVAQEAAHNAVKHAGASSVRLTLTRDGPAWALTVRDDGSGFDPAAVRGGTLGLKSMRERARLAGGTLDLTSGADGTTVTVRVPAAPPALRAEFDLSARPMSARIPEPTPEGGTA